MKKEYLMLINKYKKPLFDLLLNTIAYAFPVITAQLLVLPTISKQTNPSMYGYILTILSLMSLIPHTTGITLNNVRLIEYKKYIKEKLQGDYNIILVVTAIVDSIVFIMGWLYYTPNHEYVHLIILVILCILWLVREYIAVIFRLEINYKSICINNILFSMGYLIGTYFYVEGFFGDYWEWIYVIAQICSIVHIYIKTNISKEPITSTKLMKNTFGSYIKLLGANIISSIGDNLDKILIFSLLGGSSVSIFYAASIYTKIISLAVTPVSGVMLSYLAKKDSISKVVFLKITLGSLVMVSLGYMVCILLGRPIISLIYNEYLNEAIKYIYLTSAYAMIRLMYDMLRPFMMLFKDLNWQIVINLSTVCVFIIVGFILVPKFGITGMCISYIVGGLLRIAFIMYAFFGNVRGIN